MRGFNSGAIIPKRNLHDVIPRRFNLIVRLHPEKEASEYIVMPDSVKAHRDSTRGWFGTVIAVGSSIPKMRALLGVIKPGIVCMFDESVSIDDPNRCFEWEDQRYVMFDVETVMAVWKKNRAYMLGDRVLVRRAKKDDFKITQSKLWIPAGNEHQDDLGGVVEEVGPGLFNPERGRHLPMEFKKGDFVLFSKYGHTDIKIEGRDYAVIRQDRILATVEGEASRIKFN